MSENEDINDRLENTLKSLEETEEISSAINNELLVQREKLERTRTRVTRIDNDIKKCEKITENITSYWKSFVSFFTTNNTIDENKKEIPKNQIIESSKNVGNIEINKKNDEKSDSLSLIHQKVQGLKSNAINFGNELDLHNEIINDINQSVNNADERMKPINRKIQKLL